VPATPMVLLARALRDAPVALAEDFRRALLGPEPQRALPPLLTDILAAAELLPNQSAAFHMGEAASATPPRTPPKPGLSQTHRRIRDAAAGGDGAAAGQGGSGGVGPKPRPPTGSRPASATADVRRAALVRLAWRVAAALGALDSAGRGAMAEAMDKTMHKEETLVSSLEAALAAHPSDDGADDAERADSPISDAGSLGTDPVTAPAAAAAAVAVRFSSSSATAAAAVEETSEQAAAAAAAFSLPPRPEVAASGAPPLPPVEVTLALAQLLHPGTRTEAPANLDELLRVAQQALSEMRRTHRLLGTLCEILPPPQDDQEAHNAGGGAAAASVLKVVASTTSAKPVGSVLARDATGPRQRAINTGRVVDYVKTDGVKVRVTPLLISVRPIRLRGHMSVVLHCFPRLS
jgi:hypothetical protein